MGVKQNPPPSRPPKGGKGPVQTRRPSHRTPAHLVEPAGLPARIAAAAAVGHVLLRGRSFDEGLSSASAMADTARLPPRDRAFVRLLASTTLRRAGTLEAVIASFLEKPLVEKHREVRIVLLLGAAQLLLLATPPHAAISLAVEQCRRTPAGRHLDKLVNAVLRRVAADGPDRLAALDTPRLDVPGWLWSRWVDAYGEATARRIADASLAEAPLDLSVKDHGLEWAARLGGRLLPTGSVRLDGGGRVEDLPGYAEGEWWVQDAAAALPARLLGDVRGLAVADLCAAPGGKTAELAAAGAHVTAVDISGERLSRVAENLARLRLDAAIVAADVLEWTPGRTFDAVLLDAPCTATGTIRRHPDILHLKRAADLGALATLQGRLLSRALDLVRPGGTLVYCTCSLEAEEGAGQIERLIAERPDARRVPIAPAEVGGEAHLLTPLGDLRTLPHLAFTGSPPITGMDGFFAARLRRQD